MNNLSRHIESLLLEHNCVIVPGLGGFVAQYVPAHYIVEESLFIPPTRSIGFNPLLTINDGLLIQSYMKASSSSYVWSSKEVDKAVAEVKQAIRNEGKVSLDGIGILKVDANGEYDFTPISESIMSPNLYALDTFVLHEMGSQAHKENKAEAASPRQPAKSYTLRINREFVHYIAAAVIALVFYFAWAAPISNGRFEAVAASDIASQAFAKMTSGNEANPKPTTPSPKQASTTKKTATSAPLPTSTAETKKPLSLEAKEKEEASPQKQGYTLVLASSIPQRNAELFVEKLKAEGYAEAHIIAKPKMIRVVYGNYPSEKEAQQKLREIRKNQNFKDAWVLKP